MHMRVLAMHNLAKAKRMDETPFCMTIIATLKRRARAVFKPEKVIHRGHILPSKNLRFGGVHFQDHEAFLSAGENDARKLQKWCGLKNDSRILDIGCGTGRLAIGIASILGSVRNYQGVDVSETAIDWCARNITPRHSAFRFLWINTKNERYNPSGKSVATTFRFPFDDTSFDVIHLYSVFSHMRSQDIRTYLQEFRRLLAPHGAVFLTAFVEENVKDEEENPSDYQREWKGALHCVRFALPFFTHLVEEADLRIDRIDHGTETDGQSAFVLRLR